MNTNQKRENFKKDLNKLVDNKHAVIPNELTWEQLQKISDDQSSLNCTKKPYKVTLVKTVLA